MCCFCPLVPSMAWLTQSLSEDSEIGRVITTPKYDVWEMHHRARGFRITKCYPAGQPQAQGVFGNLRLFLLAHVLQGEGKFLAGIILWENFVLKEVAKLPPDGI